jgi:hypothetical protein
MDNLLLIMTQSPHFAIVLCLGTFMIGRTINRKTGWILLNPFSSPSSCGRGSDRLQAGCGKVPADSSMIRYLLLPTTDSLACLCTGSWRCLKE